MPKLAALGLLGIQFPEQYGGAAMSAIDYCICIEELARVDPSVALSVAAHNGLCSSHIFLFGTEPQKQHVSGAAGARREDRRLGADRVDLGQRRGRNADERDARRRLLGDQRLQDVHDSRPRRQTSWSSWR